MSNLILGYWGVRFRAQVPRHLLAYSGLQFEECKYTDGSKWFGKDRNQLGFDFPNLPYLIDGDFKLTETVAINKYIIRRSGKTVLLGKDIKDQALVQSALGVLGDIKSAIWMLSFDKQWESKIKAAVEKVMAKFEYFQKLYGSKQFALGYLTLIDFQWSQFSYYLQKLCPEVCQRCGFLKRVRNAVENLPQIKKYYERSTAVKAPFLPPNSAITI